MDTQLPLQNKVCSRESCNFKGEPQPVENFYKHPKAKDGLTAWCKTCMKASAKEHQLSTGGRKVRRKYHKKHRNDIEEQARRHIQGLIKKGLIVKPETCYRCKRHINECGPLSFHHTRGYDVQNWAVGEFDCRDCHEKADAELGV